VVGRREIGVEGMEGEKWRGERRERWGVKGGREKGEEGRGGEGREESSMTSLTWSVLYNRITVPGSCLQFHWQTRQTWLRLVRELLPASS